MKTCTFLFMFSLWAVLNVFSAQNEKNILTVQVTPSSGFVGDVFHLKITVPSADKEQIEFPDFRNIFPDSFFVESHTVSSDPVKGADSLQTIYELPVQIFDVASFSFNDIKIKVNESEWTLPPVFFEVKTALNDTEKDIRPVYGVLAPEDIPRAGWIGWVTAALLLILIIAGIIYYTLRRRVPEAEVIVPLPPWVEALQAWQSLVSHDYIERGMYHEYYYKLSQILRHYLNRRFGISAEEKTTEELTEMLKSHPEWQAHAGHLLDQFIMESDWVKFAKGRPPNEHIKNATMLIHDFIVKTTPQTESDGENEVLT